MAILILHTIDDAKLEILFKFQQKRMTFHRDIAKIRKTKALTEHIEKHKELLSLTKETPVDQRLLKKQIKGEAIDEKYLNSKEVLIDTRCRVIFPDTWYAEEIIHQVYQCKVDVRMVFASNRELSVHVAKAVWWFSWLQSFDVFQDWPQRFTVIVCEERLDEQR